eukprot:1830128-Alexandrium_andersonii.AAC.1
MEAAEDLDRLATAAHKSNVSIDALRHTARAQLPRKTAADLARDAKAHADFDAATKYGKEQLLDMAVAAA